MTHAPPPDLTPRLLLTGGLLCALGAVAAPYMTLKLGLGVDLSMAAVFFGGALLGGERRGRGLAVQLNLIQTMTSAATGVAFMVVILAAFHYIQSVFGRDIGFSPSWWQLSLWLMVSSSLGLFLGALLRRAVLDDPSLPWPTARAAQSVIDTLSREEGGEGGAQVGRRREALTVSAALSALVTYLRDAFGVIPHATGNAHLAVSLGVEPGVLGLGMLIPLSVGLSGLLGVWMIVEFGELWALWGSLSGVAAGDVARCVEEARAGEVTEFLRRACGEAPKLLEAESRFGYLVKWAMWPATALMITSALTSVLVSLAQGALRGSGAGAGAGAGVGEGEGAESLADERVPTRVMLIGLAASVGLLVLIQGLWFNMPAAQVLFAVALQPLLVLGGLRVLGLTGSGPVSLMANATQFLFGLIWPGALQQNLNAAHISADPQASSEGAVGAFWVARRVGGRFTALLWAQLAALLIASLLVPVAFNVLVASYGVGLEPGQLSAPTALKISSLALVMEQGLSALPPGALVASAWAGALGVVMELALTVKRRDADGAIYLNADGNSEARFGWVPVPSALGFALILPPSLSLSLALGSVLSAAWRRLAPSPAGSFATYAAPVASGGVAGEAIAGGVVIPALALLTGALRGWLGG